MVGFIIGNSDYVMRIYRNFKMIDKIKGSFIIFEENWGNWNKLFVFELGDLYKFWLLVIFLNIGKCKVKYFLIIIILVIMFNIIMNILIILVVFCCFCSFWGEILVR